MSPSIPDRRRRGPLLALATAGALCLLAATAGAAEPAEPIKVDGTDQVLNFTAGTLSLRDVVLRQGKTTLISAAETSAEGISQNSANSRWNLKGKVHVEFRGAILDADTAVAEFADGRIKSIRMVGAPTRFSHALKSDAQRNQGRATSVTYDAATSMLRFTGDVWYSDGRNEARTESATYNLDDGEMRTLNSQGGDKGRVQMTIRPDKRVPPPRTPERGTAQ
jgi:lipopolysaccharide transport protein LptA